MNKTELLTALDMTDPYVGFTQRIDPPAWGLHSHSDVFPFLIENVRPKTIIEVGSWLGASAIFMAQNCKARGLDCGIICIDTWLGSIEHWRTPEDRLQLDLKNGFPTFYENFLSNILRLQCDDMVLPIPLPSLIAAKLLKEKSITADLVYIDGSHDELDVYNDMNAYWELINDGGALFGDDWTWPSVVAAVEKFCKENNVEAEHDEINWVIKKTSTSSTECVSSNFAADLQKEIPQYSEPELSILILDYKKKPETIQCLESIKRHMKFPHKIIYLHNGADAPYVRELFETGLIDHFIQTQQNTGLGIGTRDLFAASFSPYSFYLQNDQSLKRDFTYEEFTAIKKTIGSPFKSPEDGTVWTARSVDLAGGVCGLHTYSERAHIIKTEFYKELERTIDLGFNGAGPYHDGPWREERIQKLYKTQKYLHYTHGEPMVTDNGHRALRQNPDGSQWEHKTDTCELRLVKGPITTKNIYPNFTDAEWNEVLQTQTWPEWKIPEKDVPYSYKEWN